MSPNAGLQLRIGGYWATTIAYWGDLTFETDIAGGPATAEWTMQLPATFNHPALRMDQLVEVMAGPMPIWAGTLAEPTFSDNTDGAWSFHADGLAARGADFAALDGLGSPTTIPDTAIDAAIGRGLPWTRPASISTVGATAEADTAPQMVNDLIAAWAVATGSRWMVNADGEIITYTEPSDPTWHMTPGSGRFGTADDDYASDVYVWTHDDDTPTDVYLLEHAGSAAAAAAYGRREKIVDITSLGVVAGATAAAMAAGFLADDETLSWTNAVSPSRYQLTTPGGAPACLWQVAAGQKVRLHGVLTDVGAPLPYVDFVIGHTSYAAGGDTITITPVQFAARDLASVLADVNQAARQAGLRAWGGY